MIAAPRPNDHRNPAILPNVFGTENSDSRIAALKGGWRTRFSPDLYTNLIGIALDFTSPPRPLDQAVSNPSRSTDGNGGPPIRLPTGSDCGFDPCYPSHPVRLSSARSTKCQQGGKSAVFATVSVSVFAIRRFRAPANIAPRRIQANTSHPALGFLPSPTPPLQKRDVCDVRFSPDSDQIADIAALRIWASNRSC